MVFSTRSNTAGNGARIVTTVELLEEQANRPWRVTCTGNGAPLFHAHFPVRSKAEAKADAMHKVYMEVNSGEAVAI